MFLALHMHNIRSILRLCPGYSVLFCTLGKRRVYVLYRYICVYACASMPPPSALTASERTEVCMYTYTSVTCEQRKRSWHTEIISSYRQNLKSGYCFLARAKCFVILSRLMAVSAASSCRRSVNGIGRGNIILPTLARTVLRYLQGKWQTIFRCKSVRSLTARHGNVQRLNLSPQVICWDMF